MDAVQTLLETTILQTQLIRHGDDLALIIEKPLLNQLGVDSETCFDVTTDGNIVVLMPVRDAASTDSFRDALEKGNQRYAGTLKKLAE